MKNNRLSAKTVFLYTLLLGAAAIFLFLTLSGYRGLVQNYDAPTRPATMARELLPQPAQDIPPRAVRFTFAADNARQVLLHADFNLWGAHEIALERDNQNTFSKTLVLPPGEYKYYFSVDGKPAVDASAAGSVFHEGQQVSIKIVL